LVVNLFSELSLEKNKKIDPIVGNKINAEIIGKFII
tara:strand:- start:380 stop:487 length:108 start_codon:yes stop_codon:yes gene_type:complete